VETGRTYLRGGISLVQVTAIDAAPHHFAVALEDVAGLEIIS
jgi:hypothetical protein